jgi:carboxylate-amine ligase
VVPRNRTFGDRAPPVSSPAAGETLGVEEEFLLVDAYSGVTVGAAQALFARCRSGRALPTGATVHRELRDTQLEIATGICATAGELRAQLTGGRHALAGAGHVERVAVVASGTPVLPSRSADRPSVGRFARVDQLYGAAARDYESCGCHVHVGVPDRDTAVVVVNHLSRWLPTLLALSVNSPFHAGQDTGYGSWRMVLQSRFPGSGLTPWFPNYAAYHVEVARLVECGVLVDDCQTFWLARPSPRLPTVELRVADTAATVDEAVLQALLSRALVRTALTELSRGVAAEPVPPQLAAAAVWSAARHGLTGPGVHLALGKQVAATDLLTELVSHVRTALDEAGDLAEVLRLLRRLRYQGTGAARQRRAARVGGLGAVLRSLSLRPELCVDTDPRVRRKHTPLRGNERWPV